MRSKDEGEPSHIIAGMDTPVCEGDIGRAQPEVLRELLIGELQHRMRNLMAVVQCFVSQTEATTADGYRAALTARLSALSDAYNQAELVHGHMSLAELIGHTLKPFAAVGAGQVSVAGPVVELGSRSAFSFGMLFHELATNASKHGAFTSKSGRIEVRWDFLFDDTNRKLALQWSEHGRPIVQGPKQAGLGLRLITRLFPEAKIEMDFNRFGLVFRMLIDADDLSPISTQLKQAPSTLAEHRPQEHEVKNPIDDSHS